MSFSVQVPALVANRYSITMHLDGIYQQLIAYESASSEKLRAILDTDNISDKNQRESLFDFIGGNEDSSRISSSQDDWPALVVAYKVYSALLEKVGRVSAATEALERTAIYGLLLANSAVRKDALLTIESLADREDEPVQDSEIESTAADEADTDVTAVAASVFMPVDEMLQLSPTEFAQELNNLAETTDSDDGEAVEAKARYLVDLHALIKGNLDDAMRSKTIITLRQMAALIIASTQTPYPAENREICNAYLALVQSRLSGILTGELVAEVRKAKSELPAHLDAGLAATTLYKICVMLLKVQNAGGLRLDVLNQTMELFDKVGDQSGKFRCELFIASEFQRSRDFARAHNMFGQIAQKAFQASNAGTFSIAKRLLGDSWQRAAQGQQAQYATFMNNAMKEYYEAASVFPPENYKTREEKEALARANLSLAQTLAKATRLNPNHRDQVRAAAQNAFDLFNEIGDREGTLHAAQLT